MSLRNSPRGFTLIELMVVVALIAGLSGGLALAVGGSGRQQGTKSLARGIVFAMGRARAGAISDGTARRVSFAAQAVQVQSATTAGMAPVAWVSATDDTVSSNQALVWAVDPATDITATAPAAGPLAAPAYVTFYPDGSATPATVFVRDARNALHWKIYVFAATGMARMVDQW